MVKTHYVLARELDSNQPYSFVSFNRTKGKGKIDMGLVTHETKDFLLNEETATEAQNHLEKRGYETIIIPKYDQQLNTNAIDLDQIIFEEDMESLGKLSLK